MFLGNPEDSVWEDWGTLGKIRGITIPDPGQNPIVVMASRNPNPNQPPVGCQKPQGDLQFLHINW